MYSGRKGKKLTEEQKAIRGPKLSKALKGKKKPDGFGEKISKAQSGRVNHWQVGDGNPSKRQDVREKISKSWENRRPIIWFTNIETNECQWQYGDEEIKFDLTLWRRGKPKGGGGFIWCTDGNECIKVESESLIPPGWRRGRK